MLLLLFLLLCWCILSVWWRGPAAVAATAWVSGVWLWPPRDVV